MTDHPLSNRLIKRFKHLQKWAKRQAITCFRVYKKDLFDYPLIADWIDGDVVVWLYDRTKDDTDAKREAFLKEITQAVLTAFQIGPQKLFIKTRKRQKGLDSQYAKLSRQNVTKTIQEGNLQFEVNLSDYLDLGLFLDHRNTRAMVQKMALNKRVLNLFAYTGSFSCYALAGGAADVTTVDLNPNYSDWTRRNMALNRFLESDYNRIITQDCFQFLIEAQKGEPYDVIICDPPTFSNSKRSKTGTFSIDEDYPHLIQGCAELLSKKGKLIFSTNSRKFNLNPTLLNNCLTVTEISNKTIPEDFCNTKTHRCWEVF